MTGGASGIAALGGDLSDTQADVLLVDAAGEPPEAIVESLADADLPAEIPTVILAEPGAPSVSAQALRAGIRAVLPIVLPVDQLVAPLQAAAAAPIIFHPSEAQAAF